MEKLIEYPLTVVYQKTSASGFESTPFSRVPVIKDKMQNTKWKRGVGVFVCVPPLYILFCMPFSCPMFVIFYAFVYVGCFVFLIKRPKTKQIIVYTFLIPTLLLCIRFLSFLLSYILYFVTKLLKLPMFK